MTQTSFDFGCGERVAIVGSRHWPYLGLVQCYVLRLSATTIIVSGGAWGVDVTAEEAARSRDDLPDPIIFRPVWKRPDGTKDLRAGKRRNSAIVGAADRVVAFWWHGSSGTADTIEKARRVGKLAEIWDETNLVDLMRFVGASVAG